MLYWERAELRGPPSSLNKYKRWGGGNRWTVTGRGGGGGAWTGGRCCGRPSSPIPLLGGVTPLSPALHTPAFGTQGAEPGGIEMGAPAEVVGAQPSQIGKLAPHPEMGGSAPRDTPPLAQSAGISDGKASALWANVSATSSGKTREASA